MADAEIKTKGDFTPREMEIMAKAWNCMVEEPRVDYNKLAAACGMSNVRSASNAWSAIKKKIMAKAGTTEEAGENGGASPAKTPKSAGKATPRKRGKKADEGEDEEGTPAKKARTPRAKKGKAVKSETEVVEEDQSEGDGAAVKGEDEGEE